MAKWGEGDPRWIVEERADATNVNNWHWTEKNATPWSKDKLRSLLEGLVIDNEKYFCEIKELTKIEGEASANNRKAKLFFFYEWELKAEWKGKIRKSDKSYKGEIEIPNLSEEHKSQNVDINVSVADSNDEANEVKEFIRTTGSDIIREQLAKYVRDLQQEFTQGMILPAKDVDPSQSTSAPVQQNKFSSSMAPCSADSKSSSSDEKNVSVKELTDKVEFKCTAKDLFQVFVNQNLLEAFTRGPAIVQPIRSGQFSLFDGNITGTFINLIDYKQLEMTWRFKTWPAEHYSLVRLDFVEKSDCTELSLTQTGVPAYDYDRTQEGWKKYYWQSIMQTFGYGAMLF